MEIKSTHDVLTVGGFAGLTAANNIQFRKRVCNALNNGHTTLEIDLAHTATIDCAGLGALVALKKFARGRGCALRLMNLTPAVKQLFDLTRAGLVLEIVKTLPADEPELVRQFTFSPVDVSTIRAMQYQPNSQAEAA